MVISGTAVEPGIFARVRRVLAYHTLVKYLVLKDLKVKSRGTYLGVVWTLLNPLLSLLIYFVIFRHVFRVQIPNYFSFFLVGFVLWVFFSRAITAATTSLVENEGLVKRAVFPLEVLPFSAVLYQFVHHLIALAVALLLMGILGGMQLTWSLIGVVPLIVTFAVFTLALALWLSTIGVFFLDARDILEVGLPILFWMTPIFYSLDMAPPFLRPFVVANPLTSFIGALRAVLIDGRLPTPGDVTAIVAWVLVALGSGLWIFARYAPTFSEEI